MDAFSSPFQREASRDPPSQGVDAAAALDRLIPELYGDLRRLAAHLMTRERSDHTLQPTELVHETFLLLRAQRSTHWRNRSHFLAIAALQMRRLLRQYARGHATAKRTPDPAWLARGFHAAVPTLPDGEVTGLLADLSRLAPRPARVAALRVLAGLTETEVARSLGVSRATVQRDWRLAKAWLRQAVAAPPSPADGHRAGAGRGGRRWHCAPAATAARRPAQG